MTVVTSDPKAKPYPFVGGTLPAKFSLAQYLPYRRGQGSGYCEEYAETDAIEIGRRALGLECPRLSTLYMAQRASMLWYGDNLHEDLPVNAAGMIYRDCGICREELHLDNVQFVRPSTAADTDAATRRGLENFVLRRPWVLADSVTLNLDLWYEPISNGLPVMCGFPLFPSWLQRREGGVLPMPAPGEQRGLSHAVAFIGFDRDNDLFQLKDNGAGAFVFWMPGAYLRQYGYGAGGAWCCKSAQSVATFPFPPPPVPTNIQEGFVLKDASDATIVSPSRQQGSALTFDTIIAALKMPQSWTVTQVETFRTVVAGIVAIQPTGMSPEGARVSSVGPTLVHPTGVYSLASPNAGWYMVMRNNVWLPRTFAMSIYIKDGKVWLDQSPPYQSPLVL